MPVEHDLPFTVPPAVMARAAQIELVLFDVDGVLTDGGLFYGDGGEEYKAFYSRDGLGMKILKASGVELGIITGRTSKLVEHRAHNLGIGHLFQGCEEKFSTYDQLSRKLGLSPEAVAFVGDDIVDLPIMLKVGLAISVQDGHYLAKRHAHWVTPSGGGRGAAREVCELLMVAQGTYRAQMQAFLG